MPGGSLQSSEAPADATVPRRGVPNRIGLVLKRLTSSWWFRVPFIYWLAGTLVYPPVYDHPPGSGYVRGRMWMSDFIGDDWNSTAMFDVGTVLYQLCFVACLAWLLRAVGTPIVRRLRPAGSTPDPPG